MTMVTRPAWGMPAAPMLAAVAVILDGETYGKPHHSNKGQTNLFCHPPAHLPDGNDLTKVHLHVVDLSDEEGRQSLVQSRPVHVNGGSNRQDKSCDSLVDSVVLLQTFEGDGEGGRTVV